MKPVFSFCAVASLVCGLPLPLMPHADTGIRPELPPCHAKLQQLSPQSNNKSLQESSKLIIRLSVVGIQGTIILVPSTMLVF